MSHWIIGIWNYICTKINILNSLKYKIKMLLIYNKWLHKNLISITKNEQIYIYNIKNFKCIYIT